MPDKNGAAPGEIENVLTQHDRVAQALVIPWDTPRQADDPRLVAYVVPTPHTADGGGGGARARVEEWQEIYDRVYTASPAVRFGENFSGWNSSYDGRPIDIDAMRQWRDATVDRIRRLRPRRVLEIGAGSGLLLSVLAPDCETYWATDVSTTAIDELSRHIKEDPRLADRVTLRAQAADRVDGLPADYFDTIVINSVTQCFPSGDYLTTVINRALSLLVPGGSFFIGDSRDLRSVDYFHTAVALGRTPGTDAAALTRAVDKSRGRDEELLIHPDYFAAFPSVSPAVAAVDIQLEQGAFHNEISRHRFDVVLHKAPADDIIDVGDCPRLRWGSDVRDLDHLAGRLSDGALPVRVSDIPNARLAGEAGACAALAEGDAVRARRLLAQPMGTDPHDLTRLASEQGLHIALVPSPDRPDHFEAVFTSPRPHPLRTALAGTYRPGATAASPTLSEVPAATHRANRFSARLRAWLRERVPEQSVPAVVITLDALPLRPDGTPDRQALPEPDFTDSAAGRSRA
ncbi:class I SAM-dependent methyltransferase [Streptomyces flaveus]|uniref:Methyltransferase type 12 domain-containing protein n=2 Tax=Streptomyces flaveus TaxID=66370 RepID=A0A917QYL2_9ACTN|nr:class I SAM-dependent methyltransferase [Streptomyces flaveus]GGK76279.1 hypothetical protein GCM10010094_41770 [Streptomyces flaveus]